MQPQQVAVGDMLTLSCRVEGTPDISVVWFKDQGKLRPSNSCSMDFTNGVATLKLKTTKFDHGEFVCKAENRVGSSTSSCHVTVKGEPPSPSLLFTEAADTILSQRICSDTVYSGDEFRVLHLKILD